MEKISLKLSCWTMVCIENSMIILDIITVICGDVKIMIKPAVYTQNIQLLEKSCLELGIKNVSLFVPVLFTKSFEDLFNKDDKFSTDKRFNERSC